MRKGLAPRMAELQGRFEVFRFIDKAFSRHLVFTVLVWMCLGASPTPRRSMDAVLPPDQRLCGVPEIQEIDSEWSYWLKDEETAVRLKVNGPPATMDHFRQLAERGYHYLCFPHPNPSDIDLSETLWIPWFAYTDPRASGISVSNQ